MKNPTDLVPLFARLSKGHILLRNSCINFGWGFICTQSATGQQNMNTDWNQMQSDSIPRVTGDAASGTQKMMKTGCICMPLDTPSNHCKFEHMQSWRDIHSIWALWQLPINCIDNYQNWQDTFTTMWQEKSSNPYANWLEHVIRCMQWTYCSFIILSTLAKNIPLKFATNKA